MTDTALKTTHQHPPLAIDANGNPIDIPDGAASWRICRKTTGRPREIVDENKHPVRFPLDMTCEQLVERCGRDVYRVYALDEVGELLDHVSTVDLTGTSGDLRNSSLSEPATPLVRSTSTAAPTDLRFALEAMTQMMRTNADALRIVTESHVDLAKTIAVAKGLPRNASAFVAPPVMRDDDDDDEVDDVERPKTWIDVAAPIVEQLAPAIPLILGGRLLPSATGNATANDQSPATAAESCEMAAEEIELAKRPNWEPRDFVDFGYAKRKGDAKRKLKASAESGSPSPAGLQIPQALRARMMTDATMMSKLMAIKAQLSDAELRALFDLVGRMTEGDQRRLVEHLSSAPIEECVLVARELIAGANATQQS
jgi:hypothetical protein